MTNFKTIVSLIPFKEGEKPPSDYSTIYSTVYFIKSNICCYEIPMSPPAIDIVWQKILFAYSLLNWQFEAESHRKCNLITFE